ncbi:hypothetical protein EDD37DRAFT_439377 [Exophiala viscosa]|uniref:Uncharacterized protein n=1 Tax=Exophiala viscosa TaxID=2486360 RepID=A0AAN6IBG5_9EURO|nr:hypothetical protein EDD36DRAFT_286964 [Exophiala viscosa]KAI1623764.1 hypothetical protein EDD37DRAFT_439377 [Exophiala viscosa]
MAGRLMYTMSTVPANLPILNPPQSFGYKDWVIKYPVPQFLHHSNDGAQNHHEVRLQKLVHFVETRFGKGRCFFSFLQGQGQRKPSQIEVTQLYALHEVKHWPGAVAQVEWTSFVMANIEYDDMVKLYGSSSLTGTLTVPVLPEAALDVYKLMKESEDAELSRICARTGKTIGQLVDGNISLYANEVASHILDTPSLTPEVDPPSISDPAPSPIPISRRPKSKIMPISTSALADLSTITRRGAREAQSPSSAHLPPKQQTLRNKHMTLRQLAQNDTLFKEVAENHRLFLDKMMKKIHQYSMRVICRLPAMQSESWGVCQGRSRDWIKKLCAESLQYWRDRSRIPWDESRAPSGPLDKQISFFCASYAVTDPLPKSGPNRKIKARVHFVRALYRQRNLVGSWVDNLKKKAEERTGVRYRKEDGFVLDLWTGGCEKVEDFQKRTQHEQLVDELVVVEKGQYPELDQ